MFKKTRGGWVCLTVFVALCIWVVTATKPQLGIDLQGGTELTYRLDLSQITDNAEDVANEVKDIISRRLDLHGLKEIRIAIENTDRLVVTIPGGGADTEYIKEQIEKAGNLRFQIVSTSAAHTSPTRMEELKKEEQTYLTKRAAWVLDYKKWETDKASNPSLQQPIEPNKPEYIVREQWGRTEDEEGILSEEPIFEREVVLINRDDSIVDGSNLESAAATIDENGRAAVAFNMRGAGATKLGDLTSKHLNDPLGIVLDERVLQAPNIRDRISTNGIITGRFSDEEVNSIVTILKGVSLPTKPLLLSDNTVGSVFGAASIASGLKAVVIGLIGVFIVMACYYLFGGLVANFALCFNVLAVLSYVYVFRQTLTLPGIAGVLLTIGMAVDANILIFERVREERKRGKSLMQALSTGYQRAFSVIFDSNLTTVITGIVLFNFGTGPVKGFAVTLIAGIIISFVSALFITRLLISTALNAGLCKQFKMLEAFDVPKIGFVKIQKPFLVASCIIVVASWAMVIPRGAENYGIDFTGGARIGISLSEGIERDEMEEMIRGLQEKSPELFLSWSLQQVQTEGMENRNYVLLTRAGSGGESDTKKAEAQSGAADESVSAEAEREAAQLVKKAVEAELIARGNLLPPPFTANWVDAGTNSTLNLQVNLVQSEELSKDDLRDRLNAILVNNPLLAPNDDEGFLGIKAESISLVTGASDTNPVSTYQVTFTTYAPPAIATTTQGALPTKVQLVNAVRAAFNDESVRTDVTLSDPFPTVSTVGPVVASNLQGKALVAFFISILGIIFYISLRFEFNFGLAAIAALVHDVMITIGLMALTDAFFGGTFSIKINLPEVAALLTIIGYSINDTIVVFDRIRENLKIHGRKRMKFSDCIDLSINQTLTRTLWTSVTTLLTVSSLLILGGEAVRGFAFTFLIGLIAGTYSSVFVASPILLILHNRSVARREAEAAQLA